MGGIKKPDSSYGRLYEKALSRPEVRDLVEAHKKMSRQRAIVAALRQQPLEPLPPLFTAEQINILMSANAHDAEKTQSKRQSRIAGNPRKGIAKILLLNAAGAYAKTQWDAQNPVDRLRVNSRFWRQAIAKYCNVDWRTIKRLLPEFGLTEEGLVEYIRKWTPKK